MHKAFKLALLGAALLAVFPASAQGVNTVAATGNIINYLGRVTYSAGFIGLVPAAATTDLVCLAGSATKTVKIHRIKLSGSGTAISVPVTVVRRISVDTGGTAASTTANPANNISKRDTTSPTATAVPIAYTANPTITDSAPTYIDSQNMGVVATTVGAVNAPTDFDFGEGVSNLRQPPTLRGTAEQICVNLNGTSPTALLSGTITWTEE